MLKNKKINIVYMLVVYMQKKDEEEGQSPPQPSRRPPQSARLDWHVWRLLDSLNPHRPLPPSPSVLQ